MNATTSLIALVLLLAAWLWVKRRQNGTGQKTRTRRPARKAATRAAKPPPSTEFHAVAIKFRGNACDAVKALSGKRFLSNTAPRIPLPECDVVECNCQFVHYTDRRARNDRRKPYQGSIGVGSDKYDQEKRDARDRREELPDDF